MRMEENMEVWTPVLGETYTKAADTVLRRSVEKFLPGTPFRLRPYTDEEVGSKVNFPKRWHCRADYVKAMITHEATKDGKSVLVMDADCNIFVPLDFYLPRGAQFAMPALREDNPCMKNYRRVLEAMGYINVRHTFGACAIWSSVDVASLWADLIPRMEKALDDTHLEAICMTEVMWNAVWQEFDMRGKAGFLSSTCHVHPIISNEDKNKSRGEHPGW